MGEFREETKNKGESVDNRATENHRVGFFHTPEQFLSMAKTVAHPMDTADHIEPVTKEAINFNLKHHPDLVKIERRKNLLLLGKGSCKQKAATLERTFGEVWL